MQVNYLVTARQMLTAIIIQVNTNALQMYLQNFLWLYID